MDNLKKLSLCTVHRLTFLEGFRTHLEFLGDRERLEAVRRALRRSGRVSLRSFESPYDPSLRLAMGQTDIELQTLTQLLLDHFEDVHTVSPGGPNAVEVTDADGRRWKGTLSEYLDRKWRLGLGP